VNAQQKTIQVSETADVPVQAKGECVGKPHFPGYYALESTQCSQYIHCDLWGNETLFNCGEGTVFQQEFKTCNYPQNVTCSDSAKYWDVNSGIGMSLLFGIS
jgi:hypothetical protein